jgi:hypothetical protein
MVSPTLKCMQTCKAPCSSCSEEDPSSCTKCISGFVYDTAANQNCRPDLNCTDTKTCSNCPFGYAILLDKFASTCTQCSSSCARCKPSEGNEGVCLSCYHGSYLDGTTCSSCPDNCMKCINGQSCLMCASGHVAKQASTQQTSQLGSSSGVTSASNEPVTCIACSAPCITCINSPTTCLSCQSGLNLIGNDCLNPNYIEVSVNFAPTGNVYSHFNDQFQTIT